MVMLVWVGCLSHRLTKRKLVLSRQPLPLYPWPCLADHNLDYHDDHADEGGGGGDFVGMEI